MSISTHRRRAAARRAERPRLPLQLHIVAFSFAAVRGFRREATVLVRGRMGQLSAIGPAYDQAGALGHGTPYCTSIRTVPAPRPTPALDALCRRQTAFPNLLALLRAPGGYRPSLRLDRLGCDGAALARAYDRTQAAWGDPRRAVVTGRVPRRGAAASSRAEVA